MSENKLDGLLSSLRDRRERIVVELRWDSDPMFEEGVLRGDISQTTADGVKTGGFLLPVKEIEMSRDGRVAFITRLVVALNMFVEPEPHRGLRAV